MDKQMDKKKTTNVEFRDEGRHESLKLDRNSN